MSGFLCVFRNIFSHERHDERLKLFSFVWEYFRTKDPAGMKKALFWLQVSRFILTPIQEDIPPPSYLCWGTNIKHFTCIGIYLHVAIINIVIVISLII